MGTHEDKIIRAFHDIERIGLYVAGGLASGFAFYQLDIPREVHDFGMLAVSAFTPLLMRKFDSIVNTPGTSYPIYRRTNNSMSKKDYLIDSISLFCGSNIGYYGLKGLERLL